MAAFSMWPAVRAVAGPDDADAIQVEYVEKQPTLEDVFFAIVGDDGKDGDAGNDRNVGTDK